jgi:hypothetical protein
MNYLVEGAVIKCPHGGQAKLTSGDSKFKIGGSAVITSGQEVGISFGAFNAPPTPDQPSPCSINNMGAPTPCSGTLAATAGMSMKLKVGGAPALLDTATGMVPNATTGPAPWTVVSAGQTLMKES